MSVNASSQTAVDNKASLNISDIQISYQGSNLLVSWSSNIQSEDSYWEVQASTDGNEFKVIGIVMGADPKSAGTYNFKQLSSRIKPGYRFYRVAHIEQNNLALASNTVRFTK